MHKSKSRGASPQLLNHGLHAIDATPARRRGGVGASPLDGAGYSLIDFRAGIDLTADYLLMRKIAWEKCEELDDFELIKKGEDLMLEGNFLRTAITSGEEPASPRHRAGTASMAWRTTR